MKYLEKMFSSNREVSNKRIMGTICIFLYIVITIATFFGLGLTALQVTLLTTLFYGGCALIGVTVVESFGPNTYGYGNAGGSYNDNPHNMEEN